MGKEGELAGLAGLAGWQESKAIWSTFEMISSKKVKLLDKKKGGDEIVNTNKLLEHVLREAGIHFLLRGGAELTIPDH